MIGEFFLVRLTVAVQVLANRIQLRQVANINQAVVVRIIVGRPKLRRLKRGNFSIVDWSGQIFFLQNGVRQRHKNSPGVVIGNEHFTE